MKTRQYPQGRPLEHGHHIDNNPLRSLALQTYNNGPPITSKEGTIVKTFLKLKIRRSILIYLNNMDEWEEPRYGWSASIHSDFISCINLLITDIHIHCIVFDIDIESFGLGASPIKVDLHHSGGIKTFKVLANIGIEDNHYTEIWAVHEDRLS